MVVVLVYTKAGGWWWIFTSPLHGLVNVVTGNTLVTVKNVVYNNIIVFENLSLEI